MKYLQQGVRSPDEMIIFHLFMCRCQYKHRRATGGKHLCILGIEENKAHQT